MNSSDLIFNIRENYKDADERLEKIYRKEFDNYSPSKLDKVWNAIEDNHIFAKAPELGNVFKYMALMGIPRTKDLGTFYNRCTELNDSGEKDIDGDIIYIECGTKYSLNSKFCPTCNRDRTLSNPLINSRTVIKCNDLPRDLKVLNELCGTCSKYHASANVRGSKCSAWNSHDEYKKAGKNCDGCCCFDCCNEKPMNGAQHASLKIIEGLVKGKL